MRFGFTPLYLDEADIDRAIEIVADVIRNSLWDQPQYMERKAVT